MTVRQGFGWVFVERRIRSTGSGGRRAGASTLGADFGGIISYAAGRVIIDGVWAGSDMSLEHWSRAL